DEADRMLDMGFIDDVRTVAKAIGHPHQTLLFSATVDSSLNRVVKELLKDPQRVDVSSEILSPKQIAQSVYLTNNPHHKQKILAHLLQH
ncbi:DEAD/DEAH box helicase, partial [Acinetobacter baumannii]